VINTLIVGGKPLVTILYKCYVENINKFKVVGVTKDLDEAKKFCKSNKVNLILLDVIDELYFMEKLNSIEKLKKYGIDIILLASSEKIKNINLQSQIVNHLIKPFEYDDFKGIFENYAEKFEIIRKNGLIKNLA